MVHQQDTLHNLLQCQTYMSILNSRPSFENHCIIYVFITFEQSSFSMEAPTDYTSAHGLCMESITGYLTTYMYI
jgi:hypothetical protein